MANPICTDPVCDTTVPAVVVPSTPVPTPTCGLPTNGVFTNATIHTNASGCITHIESGEPFLYTPEPCCPDGGTSTGGGTGLDGPKGDPGLAGTVTVGTVTTGAAGSAASVTNVGTANAAILNFVIPAGDDGLNGTAPTGTDFSQNGLIIEDGLVQQMPSWWPPVTSFNPASATGDGITVTFAKSTTTGEVQATVSAAQLVADWAVQQATQNTNITALTNTVSTLQTNLNTLQSQHDALQVLHTALRSEHDALKARVDAAGIP